MHDTTAAEAIITETSAITVPTEADTVDEHALTASISELWNTHTQAQSVAKQSRAELTAIRRELAEKLHTMKQLLARPGRNGQWSAFLTQNQIPRTTADRLVSAHIQSISPEDNCPDGAFRELTDEEVEQLATALWKKLQKKLSSPRAAYLFIARIIIASGLGHESSDDGFMVSKPAGAARPEPEVAAPAPETSTQPDWDDDQVFYEPPRRVRSV